MDKQIVDLIMKRMDDQKEDTNRRLDEMMESLSDVKMDVKYLILYRAKVAGIGVVAGGLLIGAFEIGKIVLDKV